MISTTRDDDGAVKGAEFSKLRKLDWYKFKLKCYILGCQM